MASSDGLAYRPLGPGDVAGACALNAEAGWNQVAADWRYMLAAGGGTGIEAADGRLVASSMVLPWGDRFGWIAMILVTRDHQRRGLATELMRRAIERCRDRGWIAGLDATEQGRPVYLPLGFRDVYALSRWTADAAAPIPAPAVPVRPLAAADLPAVAAWDASVFGAERAAYLAHLLARAPEVAFVSEQGGRIAGFVLGRDGRLATQVGPLEAGDEATALALLAAAVGGQRGRVFLDAADRHVTVRERLEAAGFRRQRGYTRMLLDRDAALDDPARVYVISGPEFG
jgi:ribosomal protein S18 acetylase RimI-like enzyme